MTTKPITIAGLCLSILGHLFVLAIKDLSPLSNTLTEENLTFLGLMLIWLVTITLLTIVKRGERRPFSSIGLKAITGKEIIVAVGIGVVLSLTVPLLTYLVSLIVSFDGGDIDAVISNSSWWLILVSILTAGITEEIIFRGYLIERIKEITKKNWAAIVVSLIAFVLPHLMSWNLTHVAGVVLPLGLILSLIYIWKRNLLFNMIIHIVIDLPLVILTLISS